MKALPLFAVMLLAPLGCNLSQAPVSGNSDPQEVGSRYMMRIIDQSGELGDLELVDAPAVLTDFSRTSLPELDWDNVVSTKPGRAVFRGPGPNQELNRYKFDYSFLNEEATGCVLIDVKIRLELKDGTIKTAILSLRPADDGALKVIPPAG